MLNRITMEYLYFNLFYSTLNAYIKYKEIIFYFDDRNSTTIKGFYDLTFTIFFTINNIMGKEKYLPIILYKKVFSTLGLINSIIKIVCLDDIKILLNAFLEVEDILLTS